MDRTEPSNSSDQQCTHCGLFYSIRGIDSHQRNCRMKGYDGTLHPIKDGPDVEDVDAEHGATDRAVDDDDHDVDPTPDTEGPQAPPTPDAQAKSSRNDDPSEDRSPRGRKCPACGSEDWFDPSDLPDRILQARPKLRQFDRACAECSIDEKGRLKQRMEVYAA